MSTLDVTSILNGRRFPPPASVAAPDDAYNLLSDFIESTSGQLEELEEMAMAYEQSPDSEENAAAVRRILHKMKGEAGMVGFNDLEQLFHQAEYAFEEYPDDQRADMLLRLKDWVVAVFEHLD